MNKSDLIDALAATSGLPKTRATVYVEHVVDLIQDALLRGERVTISDFGTFQVSVRKPFEGNNPKTQARLAVPQRRIPVFRAGKGLKAALNAK